MKNNSTNIKTYDKLGGWLIIFNVAFIISIINNLISAPTLFFFITQSINTLSFKNDFISIIANLLIIIGNLMIIPTICTYYLFLAKAHSFPKWFLVFKGLNFCFLLFGITLASRDTLYYNSAQYATDKYNLIINAFTILIIFPYFKFSKRVKGTFRKTETVKETNFLPGISSCEECNELNTLK